MKKVKTPKVITNAYLSKIPIENSTEKFSQLDA